MSRQVNFDAGANISKKVDLAAGADRSRWVDSATRARARTKKSRRVNLNARVDKFTQS